ncbi:DUF3293 domain-containing protein [Caldimonas tepidiphila]|uniref:DUF3293 domain-containing protein n=1 Tax=Caldimonas tepidiphila TaxID=2315841 RepID=UPI000E5C47A4|nr:DUF3293 domain-containing protein [Caldimonas tepidiphila]
MSHPADVFEIPPSLIEAYRATAYDIELPGGPRTLRIGEVSAALPASRGHTPHRIAILTASNPFSRPLPEEVNEARHRLLLDAVDKAGLSCWPAQGRDPSGEWPPEQSLALADPGDDVLDAWMLALGQNAVVVADQGQPVALRLHPLELGRAAEDSSSGLRAAALLWTEAWSTLNPDLLAEALHPDVCYESQWVFSPLEGREAVLAHLAGKMRTLERLGADDPSVRLQVQLGTTTSGGPPQPCAITWQGASAEPQMIVLFRLHERQIDRIDICIPQLFEPHVMTRQQVKNA